MSRPAFYVMAASSEIARAEAVRDALIARNFRCAYDWCLSMRAQTASGFPLTPLVARLAAESDMAAVQTCEYAVFLEPEPGRYSTGAWVELGARIGCGREVYVSAGPDSHVRCIFLALDEARLYPSDAAVIDAVTVDAMIAGYEVRS